jgi:hypothetical protein
LVPGSDTAPAEYGVNMCWSARAKRQTTFAQIGRELNLDEETAAKWPRQKTYSQRLKAQRKSKLDPYKPFIQRWLGQPVASADTLMAHPPALEPSWQRTASATLSNCPARAGVTDRIRTSIAASGPPPSGIRAVPSVL